MTVSGTRQLGAAIRSRRTQVRLTSAQVAAMAHVSRRLLIEVEAGKRPNVGLSAVIRILGVLGLDLDVNPRGLPGTREGNRERRDV